MPTRQETQQQLERITSSRTFEEALKLAPLLRHLVKCELDEQPTDEYALGIEVFGKPEDWVPMHEATVRQSMANLRKRLAQYYVDEGGEDLVLIELPRRSGYRPRFLYNPGNDALQRVRRALDRLHRTFPEIAPGFSIVEDLEACIRDHPFYAPAYAALAEALLAYTMCDETYGFAPRESLPKAEAAIAKCLQLNDGLWQAHVTAGALHCCRWDWRKAENAFETAMRIAPDETRAHFWYAAFLLAVGRKDEAKQCVTWRRKRMPEDRNTALIRPLFLYVLREYKRAYDELAEQSASWPHITGNMAYYSGDEVLACSNWLAYVLLTCLSLALNVRSSWRYAEAATKDSIAGAFNGLMVVAYCEMGKMHESFNVNARALMEQMEAGLQHQGPLSLALAYMGLGKPEEAIATLEEACGEGHPLMAWLHLWPVLDPLRGLESFKRLVAKMNLPA